MTDADDLQGQVPSNIPKPVDDGACKHLDGLKVPSIKLRSTSASEGPVDVSNLEGLAIIFCYPRSATAGEEIPPEWDAIPGARGCTPQACSFRDNSASLYDAGVRHLFGLSTQDTEYQREFQQRAHLPYDLLSDDNLQFANALILPTFAWKGSQLVKRLTLAVDNGRIVKYWYPVFPPNKNVFDVLDWLQARTVV